MNNIVTSNSKSIEIFSDTILPSTPGELELWARKNDMVNSYSSISFESLNHDLGRQKRRLIHALLSGEKTLGDSEVKNEIALTTAAIKAITETALSDIMKKEVCHHIITGDSPWMYSTPMANTIKAVKVEELTPEQFVQILGIEYHERSGTVMSGHNYIGKPREPIQIYTQRVEKNEKFSPLEKKLISYALDKKPYRTNKILTTNQLKDIDVDREEGNIYFTGTESRDFGHTFPMFAVFLFGEFEKDSFDDIMKELYENKMDGKHDIALYRRKIEESLWNKTFQADFLKDTPKTIVLDDFSPQGLVNPD